MRVQNRSFCKNPLVSEIRQSCPLIYDVSVQLSGIIREKTGITLDEDEIAYITLHLGGALETQKELANRVPAVLYCPSYYNNGQQPGKTASVQPSRASTGWILPQRARTKGCICCARISVSRRKIHTPSVTATTMPPCSARRRTPT